jgi:glycosyltransferase involved in cell wall biosynthesis
LVEYVGEIGDGEKDEFLGNAYALLFPIDWPEPFRLVMIEAMACGTPVIAYCSGSMPEVIDDGVTGFIVEGLEDAAKVADRISTLSRKRCRELFEQRFVASRMAEDYLAIYQRLIDASPKLAHAV